MFILTFLLALACLHLICLALACLGLPFVCFGMPFLALSYCGCVVRNLKTQQCLDLCLSKTRAKKILDYRDVIAFEKFRFRDVSVPRKSAKKAFPWSKERAKNKVFAFYLPSRPILRAGKTPKPPFFALPRKRLLRRLVPTLNGKPAFFISSGLKT